MSAADVRDAARRENFPVAARLLPRAVRRDLMAVYGFARHVDDAGDEADPGERPALLDAVEADLCLLYAGGTPRLPAVRALAPVVAGRGVPSAPFHHLVEAGRRDQTVRRYDTFADLMAYCAVSANPVGRIVLHVFGLATPGRVRLSDRICSALQVIEHCQDVGEDHARGRVYLPAEDLRRFGCREADLSAAHASPRLRRVIALQARRAATLLDEGMPLLATMSGVARTAVAGYVAGGRAALAALDRARHDVLGGTVRARRHAVAGHWVRVLKEVHGDGAWPDS